MIVLDCKQGCSKRKDDVGAFYRIGRSLFWSGYVGSVLSSWVEEGTG